VPKVKPNLTVETIRHALDVLSEELGSEGSSVAITLVGGAAIALLYEAREATRDVDALTLGPEGGEIREATARVAERLGLEADWLNDNVKNKYTNQLVSRGEPLYARGRLIVSTVKPEQLLAMKLCAFRDDLDISDARLILSKLPRHLDIETVWNMLEPFLMAGLQRKARNNFDDLWEAETK
jgi:hypothetical protein